MSPSQVPNATLLPQQWVFPNLTPVPEDKLLGCLMLPLAFMYFILLLGTLFGDCGIHQMLITCVSQ